MWKQGTNKNLLVKILMVLKNLHSFLSITSIFLDNLNKKNMSLVPTIPLFCETKQERKCYASTENDLYYSDSNHLTLKGAHKITNAFEAMINKK